MHLSLFAEKLEYRKHGEQKVNLESFETFLILANNHSFSKTAEIQHIVQSTVRSRIKELERYCGKRLFLRNNRQVELSLEGQLFLPYVQRILALANESKNRIGASTFYQTYLSVGSVDMIWRHTLSQVMNHFLQLNPDIALRVVTSYSDDITQLLIDNMIDIGFIAVAPKSARFSVLPVFNDEVVFVASPSLSISKESTINIHALNNTTLIYTDLSRDFSLWAAKYLHTAHRFRIKIDIVSLTIPFLVQGIAPGFIIKSLVQNELQSGQLVSIPIVCEEPPPVWTIYAVFDKSKHKDNAILKLLSLFNME